jgi:hypothetical protein
MNLYQYTATRNPMGSKAVVESYGLRADRKSLGKQLASIVARHGDKGLKSVSDIHPDLPLFQKQIDDFKSKIKEDHEGSKSSGFSNIDGQTIKNDISALKDKVSSKVSDEAEGKSKIELLIIGGVIVVALAIILKK